jgi:hypothetical protein
LGVSVVYGPTGLQNPYILLLSLRTLILADDDGIAPLKEEFDSHHHQFRGCIQQYGTTGETNRPRVEDNQDNMGLPLL